MDSLTFGLSVVRRDAPRTTKTWTFVDRPLGMQWAPDGKSVVFFLDSLGNQRFQLTILNVETGASRRPGVETTVPLARWSHDGRHLAIVSQMPGSGRALEIVDLTRNPLVPLVIPQLARYSGVAWHPYANVLAYASARDPGALTIYDLATSATRVHDIAPRGRLGDIAWSDDGRTLFVSARAKGSEFFALVRVSLEAGRRTRVFSTEGDVGGVRTVSKRHLTFDVTGRGRQEAFVASYDRPGTAIDVRSLGTGSTVVGHTSRRDSVVVVRSTLSAVARVDVVSLADLGMHEVRDSLTTSHASTESQTPSRAIKLRAKDGTYSHAFIWQSTRERTRGALIFVHGGPALQMMRDWDGGIAFAAARGVAVVGLNYRGSTGYGASYETSARSIEDQVEDVLTACRFASKELGIPPARILVWGHSYGARVVLSAALREPDAAGTYYLLSLPRTNPSALPPPKSTAMRPTVLLFQGAQDESNSPQEAEKFVREELSRASIPARLNMVVFSDEGHTFRRLWRWSEIYARVVRSVGR